MLKNIKTKIERFGKRISAMLNGGKYVRYTIAVDFSDNKDIHVVSKRTYRFGKLISTELISMEEYDREELHQEYCPVCKGFEHHPRVHQSMNNLLDEINEYTKNKNRTN